MAVPKKKPSSAAKPDNRAPFRYVRVRDVLSKQLDVLSGRNATTIVEEVNRAIREYLAREGLWPPPAK